RTKRWKANHARKPAHKSANNPPPTSKVRAKQYRTTDHWVNASGGDAAGMSSAVIAAPPNALQPREDIGPMPAVCQFAVRLLVKVAASRVELLILHDWGPRPDAGRATTTLLEIMDDR